MRVRAVIAVLVVFALSACGGGEGSAGGADEEAFANWYEETEAARLEVAGTGAARHSQAEGIASARSTCEDLGEAAEGDEAAEADIRRRMENSLSARYFLDTSIRWMCPEHDAVLEELIDQGAVDEREHCEELPDYVGCKAGPDPLSK